MSVRFNYIWRVLFLFEGFKFLGEIVVVSFLGIVKVLFINGRIKESVGNIF